MRVPADPSAPAGEFPALAIAGSSAGPEAAGGASPGGPSAPQAPAKAAALLLPQLGKTPRSPGASDSTHAPSPSSAASCASPCASLSPSRRTSKDTAFPGEPSESGAILNPRGETTRRLVDEAIYLGESCTVHVCGGALTISSANGEMASVPVAGVVARFEQERRRVVCTLAGWEYFMLSAGGEHGVEERVWRLEMEWGRALSFRRQIERLGVVQTDLSAQFKFRKFLGSGAFSDVYLAQHTATREKVAAKVMKEALGYPGESADAKVWEDFAEEVRVLAMAQGHESILRLQATYMFRPDQPDDEATESPCALVMITEHLRVGLMDLVKEHQRLPEAATRGVTESLLGALSHLNALGLAHCDVKLSNVMLRDADTGGVVLVDYGFGRFVNGPEMLSWKSGTMGYLAPEMFSKDAAVDLRCADVFSVGIVAMTCLIGRSVFSGKGVDGQPCPRAQYLQNEKCELDWVAPAACLTPVGLVALRALLAADPSERPMARDALQAPWYDLAFDDCVPGQLPDSMERRLANLTAPRSRPAAASPAPDSPPQESPAAAARKPTAPRVRAPSEKPFRRAAPGRRQIKGEAETPTGSSSTSGKALSPVAPPESTKALRSRRSFPF